MPFGEYKIPTNLSEQDLKKNANMLMADILGYKFKRWDEENNKAYSKDDMKKIISDTINGEIITKMNDHVKKYLHFDPNNNIKNNIFKKALETIIKDAPVDYVFSDEIKDIYLEQIGKDISKAALSSGHSFHDVMVNFLRDPNFVDLHFDKDVIKEWQPKWEEQYYAAFQRLNAE